MNTEVRKSLLRHFKIISILLNLRNANVISIRDTFCIYRLNTIKTKSGFLKMIKLPLDAIS